MKKYLLFIVVFSVLGFTGCVSGGRRFYSEQIRPIKDIAIVYANSDCRVDSIAGVGKLKMNLEGGGSLLAEFLPGDYIFNTRYVSTSTYSNTFGQAADLVLNAKPGHIYYIYAKIDGSGWQPMVIDIMKDGDYRRIDDAGFSGEALKNAVIKYINGDREIIQETKFNSLGREMSIWR